MSAAHLAVVAAVAGGQASIRFKRFPRTLNPPHQCVAHAVSAVFLRATGACVLHNNSNTQHCICNALLLLALVHHQGVEVLGGKPIIYSGGSFIDDYSTDDHYRNDLSTIIVAQYGAALGAAPSSLAASSGSGSAATTRSAAAAGAPGSAVTAGRHHQVEAEQQQQQAAAASSAVHTHIPTQARKGDRGTADRTPQLDQGPLPASHSSAAGGASTAAASTGSSSSQGLVLKELVARPIAITHHWRTEGGPFAAAGGGNPPYFSQVGAAFLLLCGWQSSFAFLGQQLVWLRTDKRTSRIKGCVDSC